MLLPFKYGKVVDEKFFINRNKEIEILSQNILASINVILISPRRWGKSSLVQIATKALAKKNKRVKICHIDLFSIRSEQEFYEQFANSVISASATKWEERIQHVRLFLKNIVPKIGFGVDPDAEISLKLDWEQVSKNPSEILQLPERISKQKNIKMVVCIDEFQNIAHFDNPLAFQKKLRSQWQHHQIATYVIYGSKQHMMTQLFEHKSMPFYKFGDVLFLQKIDNSHWKKYIVKKFRSTGKKISNSLASKLAQLVENHSYFVQQFANIVWINTKHVCDEAIIEDSLNLLLDQHELLFMKEIDYLSNTQVNFLKAVCNHEKQLSSKHIINKYKLGTSANVIKIKKALVGKEIIDVLQKKVAFQDPLFKIWLIKKFFKL
ncbi:MAG: AAA family ATPase [Flavobacteriales bacterium]